MSKSEMNHNWGGNQDIAFGRLYLISSHLAWAKSVFARADGRENVHPHGCQLLLFLKGLSHSFFFFFSLQNMFAFLPKVDN